MAVDPVTGALIGWLVGQVGMAGRSGLGRLVRGDRQQIALRRVVQEAVKAATRDIADAAILCDALLVDSPEVEQAEVADVLDLKTALLRRVRPTLEMLAEQGYVFEGDPLVDALVRQVMAGIQADAVREGPLAPLAEFLRHEQAVAELRGIRGGIDRLSEVRYAGPPPDEEPESGGLPGEVEQFIGRQGPLEELLRRVGAHDPAGSVAAVYTIDGMPGVGKTAFVIHAAHALAGRYPDGAIFLDLLGFTGLTPLSVSQALDELLAQARVPRTQIPDEDGPKQTLWQRRMRGRRTLIVLDNARNADQVEPLLPAAPGCLVLITARSKLYDLNATPLPLAVLTTEEARDLLTAVAGADRCHNWAAADRIVTACHRLPLAIRLMAGRVRHGDPIGEVADDVEALPAEEKIRGVFDLSYDSLDEELRAAVRMLGVYPGIDITAEVMAAVAGTSPTGGRRLLRGLTGHNLIDRLIEHTGNRPASTRYQPHGLLRDYARSRAEAESPPGTRAAALDRLIAHYLAMVRAAYRLHYRLTESPPEATESEFDDVVHANAWLRAERANLLACIDAVPTIPADLPATTGRLLRRLSYRSEGAHCYRRALTIARQTGDRSREADALRGLAHADRVRGRYQTAQERFERALAIAREAGGRFGEADALWGLADMDRRLGRYDVARGRFEQVLAIAREIGMRFGEGVALFGLAEVDRMLGRHETASEHYEQALTICRALGDRIFEAYALLGLAEMDLVLGRQGTAREHFEQALTMSRDLGHRNGEAYALRGLAETDLILGRHRPALERYEEALTVSHDLGDRLGEAYALWGVGRVAEASRDTETAGEHWREALQIFEALKIPFAETVRDALAALAS
jgi:tetratricopeptide (TPR) repeat protein